MQRNTAVKTAVAGAVFVAVALVLVTLTRPGQLGAQEASEEALAALDTFIATDSEVGAEEQGTSLEAVLPFIGELEDLLVTIALEGPPEDAIEVYQPEIDELWEARAAYLEGKDVEDLGAEGLDEDAARAALAVTEADYRADLQRTFDLKYQEKAIILLAYLEADGSVRAGDVLTQLEDDPELGVVVELARQRASDQ